MYSGASRSTYAQKDLRIFHLPSRMSYPEFTRLLQDAKVSDAMTTQEIKRMFLDSKLIGLSSLRTYNHDLLGFTDFLEALGRVAEVRIGVDVFDCIHS